MKAILSALAIEVIVLGGTAVAQPEPASSPYRGLVCRAVGMGGVGCDSSIPANAEPTLPLETTQFFATGARMLANTL